MSHRILILGASGFIGNVLYKELLPYFDVYGTYASQEGVFTENQVFYHYDVNKGGLEAILESLAPTVIISSLRGDFKQQLAAHQRIVEYAVATEAKVIYISTANVFDQLSEFPSYENDTPKAESEYGRFKIVAEKCIQQLPAKQWAILRLPLVLGVNAPRIVQLKQAMKNNAAFEVYPNLIISTTTADKVAQQTHYIINKELCGVFHLASKDVIHHEDLFKEISEKLSGEIPIFKSVFDRNEERYLAILPKKNKLPKHLRITVSEVIEDVTLNDTIITLKSAI